jgi:hypothetical protein
MEASLSVSSGATFPVLAHPAIVKITVRAAMAIAPFDTGADTIGSRI